jgi:hypothetical protein
LTNLYRVDSKSEIVEIEKAQFSDETNDFEDFIMKNERLLGKIALINHQITLPDKKRIDAWGVDILELKPVIVELKNITIGVEVISQILPYYNFVKSNPDTLKYKAVSDPKFMKKMEDLGKSRDSLEKGLEQEPRVLIVAPSFEDELIELVDVLKFEVELVEISRYKTANNEYFVTVNRPESPGVPQAVVRTHEDWDWEKYEKEGISKRKIDIAKQLKTQLDEIIKKENLNLQPIFRKLYIPYQFGRNNVFWIDLGYTSYETGGVVVWFYLESEPNLKSENIQVEHSQQKWLKDYNQWMITFDKAADLSTLTPIIRKSYEYTTGEKLS